MHINVSDILAEEEGYNRSFKIEGESPDLECVKLTKPIEGDVKISRLETGLLVEGRISTEIELECHRCLRTFSQPAAVIFAQLYVNSPDIDEMPIDGDNIDLAPLVEQEILVNLPIKILHDPDCQGVEGVGATYDSVETGNSLGDLARIKKGP